MKSMKRLMGIAAIAVLGAAMSGCVVVPVPVGYGHYHGGYHDNYYGHR